MNPGQQKISQFQPVESTRANDIIPIVRDGQNRSITIGKFTGVVPDGWITTAELWQFLSFSDGIGVVTVPEGDISRYPVGTRVQFKQGSPKTTRYGVVVSSTTTSMTMAMVNGTKLENLAISETFVSQDFAPRTSDNIDFPNYLQLSTFSEERDQADLGAGVNEQKTIFTIPDFFSHTGKVKVDLNVGRVYIPGATVHFHLYADGDSVGEICRNSTTQFPVSGSVILPVKKGVRQLVVSARNPSSTWSLPRYHSISCTIMEV